MEEFRSSGYADDTTVAATTDDSITETFNIYSTYERASGAKLNWGKSKGLWAGSWKDRTDAPHGLRWVKQLPLLGAIFSIGDYTIPTWEPAVAKLEKRLMAWSGRQLSFQGKTVVINTLALSQIWHLCHVFVISPWAEKRINKAIWSFFWSGKRDLVAQTTVTLPKSQGGFGVINFALKAESFILQWLKRFFAPSVSKWKSFFTFFVSSTFNLKPRAALLSSQPRHLTVTLPTFYQLLFKVWRALDGGEVTGGVLSILAFSDAPIPLEQLSSRNTYNALRSRSYKQPHCVDKFLTTYRPLHWRQTWSQLHICNLDRKVIDLNWQIAHGILYTGARLAHRFRMAHVDSLCFCKAGDETLEHLFFECQLAQILVAWLFQQLHHISPIAGRFTVEELLFGFSEVSRRAIPSIIIFMLLVMKHTIWVARCDFRFRQRMPIASKCLSQAIAKIKFILGLLRSGVSLLLKFEREWLARSSLGHFEGTELVFTF